MQESTTPELGFEEIAWLFKGGNATRGIIRLNIREAALLWKAVRQTNGDILEIGRLNAGSTALLRTAADSGRSIVSVDLSSPRRISKEVRSFIDDQPGVVEFLTQDSGLPIERKFGLVFIDGDHSYEGVKRDTKIHWDELQDGGIVIFHDAAGSSCCPGVVRWLTELPGVFAVEHFGTAESMVAFRKLTSPMPKG